MTKLNKNRNFRKLVNNMSLRARMITFSVILIFIPVVFISSIWFKDSRDIIINNQREYMYNYVTNAKNIVDFKLAIAEQQLLKLYINTELFNIFSTMDEKNSMQLYASDQAIMRILNQHFSSLEYSNDIYSVNLVTSKFVFGRNVPVLIPGNGFINSEEFNNIQVVDNRTIWKKTFNLQDVSDINNDVVQDINMFSLLRKLNFAKVAGGSFIPMDSDIERPVAIINIRTSIYENELEKALNVNGMSYYVIAEDGYVIAHSSKNLVGQIISDEWLEIYKNGTGIINHKNKDGEEMLIAYSQSNLNDWKLVIVCPYQDLLSKLWTTQKRIYLILGLLLTSSVIVSVWFARKLTKPMYQLVDAIGETGYGVFDTKIKDTFAVGEFGILIRKYNEMNQNISALIEKNYISNIREKEAHIKALNMQFNPHFIFNTLSSINLMAIQNADYNVSEMLVSLSNMMRYTVKTTSELVPFKMDIEYYKNYLTIMGKRLSNFSVVWEIKEIVHEVGVPKMFLQPFLENCIMHAFSTDQNNGIISISAEKIENRTEIIITDNGRGIENTVLEQINQMKNIGIGINNTKQRLNELYYGKAIVRIESLDKKGTRVIVSIPFQVVKSITTTDFYSLNSPH